MSSLGRAVRTVLPLGPGRVLRRLTRPLRGRVRFGGPRAATVRPRDLPPPCPVERTWIGDGRFRFLSREIDLGDPPDWGCAPSRLWAYHLHYLDALRQNGVGPEEGRALLASWREGSPEGSRPGWEPYPLSLRLVNALEFLARTGGEEGPGALSLSRQAWRLAGSLETDLGANHLWKNGVALAWAGRLLDSAGRERWRRTGDRIVRRELARQVLPDGFHYELSPAYHAILVEDLLRLHGVLENGSLRDDVTAALGRTAGALASVLHPDGEIPLFADAALGQGPAVTPLLAAVADRLGRSVSADPAGCPHAGIHRLEAGGSVLLLDAGPTACDAQPGHAHADTFSYELSVGITRVVVDAGVHDYEASPERRYARSTAAHNTVEVDGRDQSEVWAAFRLGRRARVLSVARGEEDGRPWVEARHDGYRFLPGHPVHARRVSWDGVGWRVEDRVDGGGDHRAVSRVRIHPDLELRQEGPEWIAAGGGVACRLVPEGPAVFVREEGAYFPRFGESRPCTVLALAAGGRTPLRLAYRLEPSTRA